MMAPQFRHHFVPKDFEGSGQYIVRELNPYNWSSPAFLCTFMYKVGFMYSTRRLDNGDFESDGSRVCLISMSDGWARDGHHVQQEDGTNKYVPFLTKKDLCDDLNSEAQGYRFATDVEILAVAGLNRRRNE